MNKIEKYQDLIITFLEDYKSTGKLANSPDVEAQIIIDKKNNHFQFLRIGWQGRKYVFAPIFHFDIKNGKIWIQRNNTEYEVVDFLMERGVPKEDIVLGFHSPYARKFTEFSEA